MNQNVNRLFFALLFVFSLAYTACTKLDTSPIGGDVVPEVDNINTFADTLDILTTQGAFEGPYRDSTKLGYTEEYVIGKVNDPLMGTTEGKLFLQFKPPFYPYYIGKIPKDTIVQADSVVLCLSYKSFWGDSTQPLTMQVYEVSEDAHGEWDSVFTYRTINYEPILNGPISDPKTIDLRQMGAFTKIGKSDSANFQIRIKLSNTFRDALFRCDTNTNRSFKADSLFRLFNNGLAVLTQSGNALVYVNLLESKTRLELHYKKKNGGAVDTVYSSFYFNSGLLGETIRRSSVANKVTRNRLPLPGGSQELFLQTTPGTFATLEIPELSTLSNRVIHRAELQIQQIPDPILDPVYSESPYLYLDLVDSGTNKWKPLYYDLNPVVSYDPDFKTAGLPYFPLNGEVDLNYFGGFLRKRITNGSSQAYYTMNVTRYVQKVVNRQLQPYKMRLFPAHSFTYPQYSPTLIPYRNPIAFGRVRVGGGANPNPNYRMRLRIVYSNIK